jgi:hypothetical protein
MPNVAIVFFGMARSTRLTIDSIRAHVYAPNDRPELRLTRFASLNIVDKINNIRSNEFNIDLPKGDQFLLECDSYLNFVQDDENINDLLESARTRRDVYQNDWQSVRNLLHQLMSLKRAWRYIKLFHGDTFDYFVFLRPDLMYLDPINLAEIIGGFSAPNSIAVPAWQSHDGLNDRFAVADAVAARHYANRIDRVAAMCRQRALHAESLLRFVLATARCNVLPLAARARRVRADGRLYPEVFTPQPIILARPRAAAATVPPPAASDPP